MTAATNSAPQSARTTPYAWFVLAMLCFVYIFNFMDRQLMSVLAEDIKKDLDLTDTQIGLMTGFLFALFYTLLGVAAGWLADRSVRVRILAIGAFLWSLFTLLCGKAPNFGIMATARMGVGVGEAAGAPPSYSIVSDYFPAERRGAALAIFSLGVPFGIALGSYIGPTIARNYDWRLAFISIGLAGAIAAVVLYLTVKEPKRGATDVKLDIHMEEAPTQALRQPFYQTVNEFFGRPVLLSAAVACGLAAFVGYAVLQWTIPLLRREFGDAAFASINLQYSLMLAVAMGLGTWLSGEIVDRLARRSKVNFALLPMVALILAIPGFIGFVLAPSIGTSIAFLAIPTFLNIFYLAPALAVVQNSVGAGQRTAAGALLLLVLNLIGLGGGPTMIGILSDHFNDAAAAGTLTATCQATIDGVRTTCAAPTAVGLKMAMLWLVPFYIVGVLALAVQAWFMKKEIAEGVPSSAVMARNAKVTKLVAGFGGIVLVLIFEQLAFGAAGQRDLSAISDLFSGAKLSSQMINGLTRDLLMLLMLVVGIMGVYDIVAKPKAAN